ncbi:hypothetical protein F7R91_14340 [Streptomyces luteolifulvus]|uniref:Uncharacterized protein n=1 Tax=Streptomyces luteolifulvus TaxID=2615112 RepID=A0A6H9V1G9_9ACTN|nr:hypothetical protein [Streptomyces luteolifulvus]KAB1146755.1 hypothetical protein F7R91_14340 [Streptomyces luteolifulvus]
MTAPARDMTALDVPAAEVAARMARNEAVFTLLTARLQKPKGSHDLVAYALDVALIESDARVATDENYPQWATELAALPTYYRPTAPKEATT